MYIEEVLLLNFLLDFIILEVENILLKKYISLKRLLLGTLIASTTTFILFININNYLILIIKLLLSTLIIIITFGKKEFLKSIEYFYLLSIILGGSFYLINLNITNNIIITIIISIIVLIIYYKDISKYKKIINNIHKVVIINNKNEYHYKGYLDTGNTLKDMITKRPVIIVSSLEIKKKKYFYVPYKSINGDGVMKCIKVDYVLIDNTKFKDILIGVSKTPISIHGADCILPNIIKEDI